MITHVYTVAHTTTGDVIADVIAFEGERAFCRVVTMSFQTQWLWLPTAAVTVTVRS